MVFIYLTFGPQPLASQVDILGSLKNNILPSVTNHGVTFNSSFKFDKQVSSVVKTCFLKIRLPSRFYLLKTWKGLLTPLLQRSVRGHGPGVN